MHICTHSNTLAHTDIFTLAPALHNTPQATHRPLSSICTASVSTKASQHQPFILSKVSPPVPAEVVTKVQAFQFVNIQSCLLPNNTALLEQLSAPSSRHCFLLSKQCDILSLTIQVCTSTTYMYNAVLVKNRPDLEQTGLHV